MSNGPHPRREDIAFRATPERIGRAIDDELQGHMEERVADLVREGMTLEAATARAVAEFGDLDASRVELRDVDNRAAHRRAIGESLLDAGQDFRRATRGLARRPGFTLTAVLTLALGIGANSMIFGLVDRLLLSPPPHVRDAAAVAALRFDVARPGGRITWLRASYPSFQRLAQRTDLFEGVAASVDRSLTLVADNRSAELRVAAVTENYFEVLGSQARLGRVVSDDATDSRSVVISHSIWKRELGGSPAAIGQRVRLGGEAFTVIGVMPPGFAGEGIDDPFDAWISLGPSTPTLGGGWQSTPLRAVFVVARLRDATQSARIAREATMAYRQTLADANTPDSTARVLLRELVPGRTAEGVMTAQARVALWLQVVSVLVLIIAVANVANLLLLRALERQRETAVRLALGITRGRLVAHLLMESAILAGAGGLAAVALAVWIGPVLWSVVMPSAPDVGHVTARLGAAALLLAIVCAVAMTAVPAVVQRGWRGTDVFHGSTRGATRRQSRLGDALVVVQVSLTVVLLVGAGLFARSMQRLSSIDLGIEPARFVTARLTTPVGMDSVARRELFRRVESSLRALPGAEAVAFGQSAPYRPSLSTDFRLPGREQLPGVGDQGLGFPTFFAVSPDFTEAFDIRLLRGRRFSSADRAGSNRVMLIDATMAATFWPGDDPLGRCVRLGADSMPCTTVVGVVEDTRRTPVGTRHSLRYYLPIEQSPFSIRERYFFIRTRNPAALVERTRAAITRAAPAAPFIEVFPLDSLLDDYTGQWRLGRAAFTGFAVLATVVATIGLFGVISFGVARRQRELGIRSALGASRGSIVRNVSSGALLRSGVGLVVGGVLSFALARRLQDLLFEPAVSDAAIFAVAVGIVLAATAVASLVPAARAVRADPMQALRAD